MSKPDNPFELSIKITGQNSFLDNLASSISKPSGQRVSAVVKRKGSSLCITIKAKDLNILLAVNNSLMQFLKMINTINLYG